MFAPLVNRLVVSPSRVIKGSARNAMELLLHCLRCAVSPEFVRASSVRLNWREVIRLAERFDTIPLLYMSLAKTGAHLALPGDCSRDLISSYLGSAARSIRFRTDLKRIVTAFSRAGIPVVLLKGAALATVVYQDFTLRPMGDIDLLVNRRDLDRARECLLSAGYRPDPDDQSVAWYRANHHHDQPVHSVDRHVTIELHFDIIPPSHSFNISVEELWNRALPVDLGNCPALTLSNEDLILHSCVHLGSIHGVTGHLKSLIDIATMTRRFRSRLRWPLLVEMAIKSAAIADVYYALLLSKEYAGAEVPTETLLELRSQLKSSDFERRLAIQVLQRAVLQHANGFVPTGLTQAACRILLSRTSLPQKLRTASKHAWRWYRTRAAAKVRGIPFSNLSRIIWPARRAEG